MPPSIHSCNGVPNASNKVVKISGTISRSEERLPQTSLNVERRMLDGSTFSYFHLATGHRGGGSIRGAIHIYPQAAAELHL